MNAVVVSWIRTGVALAFGWLFTVIATKCHFIIDPSSQAQFVALFTAVITSVYYALVRLAESRYPQIGLLLGVAKQPDYTAVSQGTAHANMK